MAPTYPGSPELTVDALLARPRVILRELGALANKRFVADRVLTQGAPVSGGAVWYQKSESIYVDRNIEEVGIRSEFPRAGWTEQIFSAAVHKYGLEVPIAYEVIRRNQVDQVARATRKLANSAVKFVDTLAMNMLIAEAGHTTASNGQWDSGSHDIVKDLATGRAYIINLEEGYDPNTLIIHPNQELAMLLDSGLRSLLPRETDAGPLQTGRVAPILGFEQIIVTPQVPARTAIIMEARTAGTIADEVPDAAEGYTGYDPGAGQANLYVKVYNNENRDEKYVRCARFPAMWLGEPNAVYTITNT